MFRLICKISWASLSRRRSRSVLVVLMISMCLWGLLFMQGLYDGMTEQMIDNAIRSGSGDITLHATGYRHDKELGKLITNGEHIKRFLQEDNRVKSSTTRLSQESLIATAHSAKNGILYGIELNEEQQHGRLDSYIVEGSYTFLARGNGAIIGYQLAKNLKAEVGKKIIVSAQDINNEVASLALKISGIIKTNNMAMDEAAVFISQSSARQLLSIPTGLTQICVILHNEEDMHNLQREMQQRYTALEVLRWDEVYPALMQSRVMMEGFNLVTSLLVFCIAGLGIFGVIMVSVLERLREFGILLAVGAPFRQNRPMGVAEYFFFGLLGFFGGALLWGLPLYFF